MVYCDYKNNTDSSVTYAYGTTIYDITGELVFHFKEDLIEIVKQPEKGPAMERHLKSLYGKHRDNFRKGVFKEKISYEI